MDLIEILKKCAQGTKLYSPIVGEVKFNKIVDRETYGLFIDVESTHGRLSFDSEGKLYKNGECLLFPSKEQRDWNEFELSSVKETNPWMSADTMLPYECEETSINDNITCNVIAKDYLGRDYIAHMKREGGKWIWINSCTNNYCGEHLNKQIKYWTIIPKFYNFL